MLNIPHAQILMHNKLYFYGICLPSSILYSGEEEKINQKIYTIQKLHLVVAGWWPSWILGSWQGHMIKMRSDLESSWLTCIEKCVHT